MTKNEKAIANLLRVNMSCNYEYGYTLCTAAHQAAIALRELGIQVNFDSDLGAVEVSCK